MTDRAALERECRALCRHLISVGPTAYVVAKYAAAHAARPELAARSPFDRALLRLAIARWLPTEVPDAYARLFAPRGALRRKLTLLLAILESAPESHLAVEHVAGGGRVALTARLLVRLGLWLLALAVGAVALAPVQILTMLFRGGRGDVTEATCQPPPRGRH